MVEANESEETEVDEEPRHPSSMTKKEPHHRAGDTHGSCRPRCNDDCEPTQTHEEGTVVTVPLTVTCREDSGDDCVDLTGQTKQDAINATDENNSGTTASGTAPSRCGQAVVDEAKRPPPESHQPEVLGASIQASQWAKIFTRRYSTMRHVHMTGSY